VACAPFGIRQQEDAGMRQLPARGFPSGNQLFQGVSSPIPTTRSTRGKPFRA
jgi:hypothetical protein